MEDKGDYYNQENISEFSNGFIHYRVIAQGPQAFKNPRLVFKNTTMVKQDEEQKDWQTIVG